MGVLLTNSRFKTGVELEPEAGAGACYKLNARFDIPLDLSRVADVQIVGAGQNSAIHWREVRVKNRRRHRHIVPERRFIELGPVKIDLMAGPAEIVTRGDDGAEKTLATVDLPGLAAKRFRSQLQAVLDQNLATGRAQSKGRRLSAIFAAVPADFSNPDWLESEIILKSLQKLKSGRTHDKLDRLNRIRRAQGCPGAFDAFTQMLTSRGVRLPTAHGYATTFAERDMATVLAQLGAMMDVLKGHGLTVFANSGTLLGLVREGVLLGHDDDIDLAVVLKAKTHLAAAAEWNALRKRLGELSLLADDDTKHNLAIIKLRRIDDVTVDLFPAWFDSHDRAHVYPHTKGEMSKSGVLPLVEGPSKGIMMPRDAKAMLALNYGDQWQVPDPTFRFPWGNAIDHFQPFTAALGAAKE